MKPYRLAIDWDAVEILRGRTKSEQRQVAYWVNRLREHPFQIEPYVERDESGRVNQVAVVSDLLIHYWADHADRTLRVTRIEPID